MLAPLFHLEYLKFCLDFFSLKAFFSNGNLFLLSLRVSRAG